MLETDWRKVISDPIETKLFDALEDPRWEWRTISALSRATGLGPEDRGVLPVLLHARTLAVR